MRANGSESWVSSLHQQTIAIPDEGYLHQIKPRTHANAMYILSRGDGNEAGLRGTNNEPPLSRCLSDSPRTDGFLDQRLGR